MQALMFETFHLKLNKSAHLPQRHYVNNSYYYDISNIIYLRNNIIHKPRIY